MCKLSEFGPLVSIVKLAETLKLKKIYKLFKRTKLKYYKN